MSETIKTPVRVQPATESVVDADGKYLFHVSGASLAIIEKLNGFAALEQENQRLREVIADFIAWTDTYENGECSKLDLIDSVSRARAALASPPPGKGGAK